jgi:hypothetical protein
LEDDVCNQEEGKAIPKESETMKIQTDEPAEPLWILDFDGSVSKEGSIVGVWVHNHKVRYSESHSCKLNF